MPEFKASFIIDTTRTGGHNPDALRQAVQSAREAGACADLAEEQLNHQSDVLSRLRKLVSQGFSEIMGEDEREALQQTFRVLIREFDRSAPSAGFNDLRPFNDSISAPIYDLQVSNSTSLEINTVSVKNPANALSALKKLDEANADLARRLTQVKEVKKYLSRIHTRLQVSLENISAAQSTVWDSEMIMKMAGQLQDPIPGQLDFFLEQNSNPTL